MWLIQHHREPSRNLLYNTPSMSKCTKYSTELYSRNKPNDENVLDSILSPVEHLWKLLSLPIGDPTMSLPLIFPLTILLFNLFFNNVTSILFDAFVIAFYAFIRKQNETMVVEVDEDDVRPPAVLVYSLVLFGSLASALLISPNGFQTRNLGGAPTEIIFVSVVLFLLFGWSRLATVSENPTSTKNHRKNEETVDPSRQLLDLWDDKFEN